MLLVPLEVFGLEVQRYHSLRRGTSSSTRPQSFISPLPNLILLLDQVSLLISNLGA